MTCGSSFLYLGLVLLSLMEASICLIALIRRCASSVNSCFSLVTLRSWPWRVSESAEKSCTVSAMQPGGWCSRGHRYLCLARIALMAGHSNLIKQAVQLADDGGDLLSEVAGVHVGCRPASGVVGRVCTVTALRSGAVRR